MRVADFFCGGGGFSEGFRQAGFEIVFAVDKWEPAVTTYKGNKPGVNVIQDDIIRLSNLDNDEFEKIIPDSEIIIGSPPCQAFSQSNKSGNADKTMGIQLIEAYLRIVARKKFKKDSVLKYWVLENVPNSRNYIKEEYTAADLGIEGDFVLHTRGEAAGIYNAKNYGAPTNRKRFLCGEFPALLQTHTDEEAVKLKSILDSLGDPLSSEDNEIKDVNYPNLTMPSSEISDFHYIHELAPFEWEVAKRLKQDKGYMGRMSFPENVEKPARTVMATMTASSREAMILAYKNGRYRLPTVRETASMMSFPLDYKFYGATKGIKHTLVGNAVPPKLSYAIAKAIAMAEGLKIPDAYIPIHHDASIAFTDLNGIKIPINEERPRRDVAKFKYHIPYLIINAYRVELTNYRSVFEKKEFRWDAEIHYSQGKNKAAVYTFDVESNQIDNKYRSKVLQFLREIESKISSFNEFQKAFCKTAEQRNKDNQIGPYELLNDIRFFIDKLIPQSEQAMMYPTNNIPEQLPNAIFIGYFIMQQIVKKMGGLN